MSVYVVTGATESGDEWCLVFSAEPTEDQIVAQFMEDPWLREEWEADCIQGWQTSQQTVIPVR